MIETMLETREGEQLTTLRTRPLIMIVDDNIELLEELENLLKLSEYDIFVVNDCTKAIDAALNNRPDLVLLDLKMSPKSGFQIADEMKHSAVLKDTPVIAMTGFFTEKQHLLMMKICGIRTSILKPFQPLNLITKIEFALGNRREEYPDEGT